MKNNMKLIPAFLLAAAAAFAQCPSGSTFPTSLDTNATLEVAVNNLGTNLTATLSPSSTTAIVTSTAGWVPYMAATVDTGANQEIVFVTGIVSSTVLSIVHPCEGTSAVTHSAGVPFVANVTAYSGSTGMKSAIFAVEAYVLAGGPGTINPGTVNQVAYYSATSGLSGDAGLTYVQGSALLTATNASFGAVTLSSITGSTQCLQVNASGVVGGSGSTCGGGGGSGTINSAAQYSVPYYSASGTSAVLSGASGFTFTTSGSVLATPHLTISSITGSAQCLNVNTSGVVSGTGGPCGTTNTASQYDLAYYSSSGSNSVLSGNSSLSFNTSSSILSTPNLTITGVTGTQCLQATSGIVSGTGSPCGSIASESQYDVAFYPNNGSSLSGSSNFTFNSSTNKLTVNALSSAAITDTGFVAGTFCVEAINGVFSSTGNPCATGTLTGSGTATYIAYYSAASVLTGSSGLTYSSGTLTTGAIQAGTVDITTGLSVGPGSTSVNGLLADSVTISGTASTLLYRCTASGGTLRLGQITSVPGDCASPVSIDLTVN